MSTLIDISHCGYCGKCLDKNALELDHMVPKSRGGTNHISNRMPTCVKCNRSKRTKDAEEYRRWVFDHIADRVEEEVIPRLLYFGGIYGQEVSTMIDTLKDISNNIRSLEVKFYFESLGSEESDGEKELG